MHRIKIRFVQRRAWWRLFVRFPKGEAHLSSDFIDRVKGVMYWVEQCALWILVMSDS